jgi:plastocyanin
METSNLQQNEQVPIINTRPKRTKTTGRWLTLAVALVIVGAASLFVVLQRNGSSSVAAAPSATVEITADGFRPQTIRIKKGESVTWVNKDSSAHHVVADPFPSGESLPSLNSDSPLAQDESYNSIFENTGSFTYHDQLNPAALRGTIIVE